MNPNDNHDRLPGGEILRDGLRDLKAGDLSVNALLVLTGAYRLTRCGIQIPNVTGVIDLPEHLLYRRLSKQYGPDAYRHYRSLIQRLVSLESALEGCCPGSSAGVCAPI